MGGFGLRPGVATARCSTSNCRRLIPERDSGGSIRCTIHVFIIDDDESLRDALRECSDRWVCGPAFASAPEFQVRNRPDVPSLLVLDVRLPG